MWLHLSRSVSASDQISWVSDSVRDFSPGASSAMETAKEMKFGTKVA